MTARLSGLFIYITLFVLFVTMSSVATQPAAPTIAPTLITFQKKDATLSDVATALSKASGVPISIPTAAAQLKYPASFSNVPFWDALEQTAKHTGMKIVLFDKGTKVGLEPRGMSQELATVNGPFRIAAKQVIGRALLDLGAIFHEIYLDVHWEPRIPVFRIDTQPRITQATDDCGVGLKVTTTSASSYPTEAITDMRIKVTGLTRESKKIGVLAGEFRVTAAEKILVFKFEDLTGKLPISKNQSNVKASVTGIAKPDKVWEVELELLYPENHPAFESFEEQKWLRDNKLQLVSPDGKPIDPESEEVGTSGRRGRVVATYRFPGTLNPLAKGWSLIYEAPSPLMEFKVPFELKNIPLP
jgi:hypothetical protein